MTKYLISANFSMISAGIVLAFLAFSPLAPAQNSTQDEVNMVASQGPAKNNKNKKKDNNPIGTKNRTTGKKVTSDPGKTLQPEQPRKLTDIQQDAKSLQDKSQQYLKELSDKLLADPDNVVLRNLLASTLATVGQYDSSAFHYDVLLAGNLSPQNRSAVLNNYGNLFFLRHEAVKADTCYLLALEADSSHINVFLNRGTLYTALQDDSTAQMLYRHVVSDSMSVAQAERLLGLEEEDQNDLRSSAGGAIDGKNLKDKAKNNLRQAPKKKKPTPSRPTGRKNERIDLNPDEAFDIADVLYWAEVKPQE